MKKFALWVVAGVIALATLYIAYPQIFGGNSASHTFTTPKGDFTLRFDKQGNLTGLIPSSEAEKNDVTTIVTFQNGVRKYCGAGRCSTDAPVKKIEAQVDRKTIATWP